METKPAYKTTEFYIAIAAMIIGVLATSGVFAQGSMWAQVIGIASTALVGMGYPIARGIAKSGNPPANPPQA